MRAHFFRSDELRVVIGQGGFCVKGLAAHLGLEVRTLGRRFVEHFGTSPKVWIMRERMILASPLLAEGLSNKEVAVALGFTCESSFCRAFKRYFGRAPQAFARLQEAGSRRSLLDNESLRSDNDAELSRSGSTKSPPSYPPGHRRAFTPHSKILELRAAAVDEPYPVRLQPFE